MNRLIAKLNDIPESYSSNMAKKTKTDIVSIALSYIKECKEDLFDKSFQDEISSLLTRVVKEASESLEYAAPDAKFQSLCMLAAVLKLMSSVLFRTVSLLRYNGDQDHPKCLSDIHLCKDYDILESIIGCFGSSEVQLPVQNFLCDLMKTSSTKHEKSRMMFLHFSGLLSHALNTGFDFLIKGSLLVLMALMNLFVFEEGNLNIFCQPTKEKSNGEPFLNLVLGPGKKIPDFDDLADFIECEPGKDYAKVIENRRKFREWKIDKRATLWRMRKIEAWRAAVSKKTVGVLQRSSVNRGKDYAKVIVNRCKSRKWKEDKRATLGQKRKKEAWRAAASKKILGVLQRSLVSGMSTG